MARGMIPILEDIRALVRRRPFEPFCIFVSDGSRFEVLYYDFVLVTRRYVRVATGVSSPDEFPKAVIDIDPERITRVEPIHHRPKRGRARKSRQA